MKINISSTAFNGEELIPIRYTCDGDNISPPLNWNKPDDRIKSFAMIVDDPDAPGGDFVHWVVYNISPSVSGFPENVNTQKISKEILVGRNDFGESSYGGPCPPFGTHRYYFRIYGLDSALSQAKPELTKHQLLKLMEGHVIESGELVGKYQRKR